MVNRVAWLGVLLVWGLTWAGAPSRADAAEQIAGRTVSQYADQLADPDRVIRLRAARSLGAFGTPAAAALTGALNHDDPAVQYVAATSLGRIGGAALQQATPQLTALAADSPSVAVRLACSYALCRGGDIQHHLPTLIKLLQHPSRGIACSAADLIGQIGPPAVDASEPLTACYEQNRPGTRRGDYHLGGAANNALRKIRAEEPRP